MSSRCIFPFIMIVGLSLRFLFLFNWIKVVMVCSNKYYTSVNKLLTYSMVQSSSWEAKSFAAGQEISHISRNPKVHYRTHKRPPPVPILGQPNPVHIPTYHLLEIHPNIIHPSTPRSHQWSLSLRFSHQDPIHPPLLSYTRHMPSPSHSSDNNTSFILYTMIYEIKVVLLTNV